MSLDNIYPCPGNQVPAQTNCFTRGKAGSERNVVATSKGIGRKGIQHVGMRPGHWT